MFLRELNQPVETAVDAKGKPSKQTYFQKMKAVLESNPQTADEIEDFTQFDPSGSSNRWKNHFKSNLIKIRKVEH